MNPVLRGRHSRRPGSAEPAFQPPKLDADIILEILRGFGVYMFAG